MDARQANGKPPQDQIPPRLLPTMTAMLARKAIAVFALLLMVVSLGLVALDMTLFPEVNHQPGQCPICSWAQSLASSVVPVLVILVELTAFVWVARELPYIFYSDSVSRTFSARAPPSFVLA